MPGVAPGGDRGGGGRGRGVDVPPQQAECQVRRDDERHRERRQHRRRGADRDGPHVRSHHPGDERHREDRRDHGERRQDGGIADFVDPLDCRLLRGGLRSLQVAVDVLDHHNGVVDENADREDQCEERDAVEGVAQQIVGEQRQRQCHRHRDQYHHRLADTEEDPDQRGDGKGRDEQMEHQLARLVRRGPAVVPGHVDDDRPGNQSPARGVDLGQDAPGDIRRVRARTLGQGEGDGRRAAAGVDLLDVLRHVGGPFGDRCDAAEIDRFSASRGDDHLPGVVGGADRRAGTHQPDLVVGGEFTGIAARRGVVQRTCHLAGGHAVCGQPGGIEADPQCRRFAADDRSAGDIRDGAHLVLDAKHHLAEAIGIEPAAMKGEGEDRYVVDAMGHHQRFRRTRRCPRHRRHAT